MSIFVTIGSLALVLILEVLQLRKDTSLGFRIDILQVSIIVCQILPFILVCLMIFCLKKSTLAKLRKYSKGPIRIIFILSLTLLTTIASFIYLISLAEREYGNFWLNTLSNLSVAGPLLQLLSVATVFDEEISKLINI